MDRTRARHRGRTVVWHGILNGPARVPLRSTPLYRLIHAASNVELCFALEAPSGWRRTSGSAKPTFWCIINSVWRHDAADLRSRRTLLWYLSVLLPLPRAATRYQNTNAENSVMLFKRSHIVISMGQGQPLPYVSSQGPQHAVVSGNHFLSADGGDSARQGGERMWLPAFVLFDFI